MSKEAAVTITEVEQEGIRVPPEAEVVDHASLRKQIFKNAKKPQRREYTFNGVMLEYVQPSIGSMYSKNQDESGGPTKAFIIKSMIENSYAPGTNDRVFEDSDYDAIMEMPASGELSNITTIISELLDLGLEAKVKN